MSTQGRPPATLHFAVGEINGKLDQLIASLLPQFQSLHSADEALHHRVTSLERGQWLVMGGGTLFVFIVSAYEVIRYVIL